MDRTEEGDEASKTQEQPRPRPTPRRAPADTGPEPSIKPGSLSRTLGHIALTVLAVVVLYTAYQHSRRDNDNEGEGRAGAEETTTTTAAGGGQVTTTTADVGAQREPSCPPENGPSEPVRAFTGAPASLVNGALQGSCVLVDPGDSYVATVETTKGDFEITLDAATAPQTVNNFVFLARWRFYEGAAFYSVVPDLSIDTGDPVSQDGQGDAGYSIPDELPPAEPFYPPLSVYMTNAGQANTNATEFSIVTGPEGERLPPRFTRFGRVSPDDESVIRSIEATGDPNTLTGQPMEETVIERITIREE